MTFLQSCRLSFRPLYTVICISGCAHSDCGHSSVSLMVSVPMLISGLPLETVMVVCWSGMF